MMKMVDRIIQNDQEQPNQKVYNQLYYLRNKEQVKERVRQYYQANKEQIKELHRQYYQANKELLKVRNCLYHIANKEHHNKHCSEHNKIYRQQVKLEVLTHYGHGVCRCLSCGFADIRALSIDHINNDGHIHRSRLKLSKGLQFYTWLKKEGYPEGYQTLCMNCQFIKQVKEGKKRESG